MRSIHQLLVSGLLLVVAFRAQAQSWAPQLKPQNNFFETRNEFDKYWAGKKPEKGKGYKPFKRWEWFWEQRVGKTGQFPKPTVEMEAWQQYEKRHASQQKDGLSVPGQAAASASGSWRALGPASSSGGYSGIGRLNCMAFHPTDPNVFWVGSPAGGLWKTTDGGKNWATFTDNLPVLGVSAIAVDNTDPHILYIGTGDHNHWDTRSAGVLKSTNGGITWNPTGLSWAVEQYIVIKGLIIHPANTRMLLAATSRGIYKTGDAGASWTKTADGDFQEIKFKPGDPSILYAAAAGYNAAQVFRSTNTGDSWTQVTSFASFNRIALAVTPANTGIVGALCSNSSNSGFGGYYTSTNSGASFAATYLPGINLLGGSPTGSDAGGQGWYDLCLAISPANDKVVYAGGINSWNSVNAGRSWSINTMWYGYSTLSTVHADKHFFAYHPLNPGVLFSGNDGGLYKTSDGGATWQDISNNLQITQFYRIGTSATNSTLLLAGAQDNGTKKISEGVWGDVMGGDGMECLIDYSDANVMYATFQGGVLNRSTNGGLYYEDITPPGESGAWVTPFVMDPVNPRTLYAGYKDVYKSVDQGTRWSRISKGLSSTFLQTIAVAPSNPQIIYAATYNALYVTTNGGGSWSLLPLPAPSSLTYLTIHPTNPQTLWITFSGYSSNNKVYQSTDGGLTWTNISGTLPNLPVNCIVHQKTSIDNTLYVGTDVGVFVRNDAMPDWQPFDDGLPHVIVNELEIQYSAGKLRAATFGRGLWESDLFNGTRVATYCIPNHKNNCVNSNDYIDYFSLHTLSNKNSGCNARVDNYINYPVDSYTTSLVRGNSYQLSLQSGSAYPQGFGVWIDYNNDRDFTDAGEFVYGSPNSDTAGFTSTIAVPNNSAFVGKRRLRVRGAYNQVLTAGQACETFDFGETEDYTITIANPSVAAPTNLKAVAFSSSRIDLTWTDNSSRERNYPVERGRSSAGPFAVIATLAANATSYSDAGLSANTSYYYRVRATGSSNSDFSKVATATTLSSVLGTVRLNSGGSSLRTSLGSFSADAHFAGSSTANASKAAIANTADDSLYQVYRRGTVPKGSFNYNIPVVNGTYLVKLHFAEVYFTAIGQRQFSVTAEGLAWLTNYDVVADVGAKVAAVKTRSVTVSDGNLTLKFISLTNYAMVAAIEVLPTGSARKTLPEILLTEDSFRVQPNPIHGRTTLIFRLNQTQQAKLEIVDSQGRLVKELYSEEAEAGKAYAVEWNAENQPSGLYVGRLSTKGKVLHQKLILQK